MHRPPRPNNKLHDPNRHARTYKPTYNPHATLLTGTSFYNAIAAMETPAMTVSYRPHPQRPCTPPSHPSMSASGGLFAPTLQNQPAPSYSDASLWGIEEEPTTVTAAINATASYPQTNEPPTDADAAAREYWERELDVKMVFSFLARRFSRPSSPTPNMPSTSRSLPTAPATTASPMPATASTNPTPSLRALRSTQPPRVAAATSCTDTTTTTSNTPRLPRCCGAGFSEGARAVVRVAVPRRVARAGVVGTTGIWGGVWGVGLREGSECGGRRRCFGASAVCFGVGVQRVMLWIFCSVVV